MNIVKIAIAIALVGTIALFFIIKYNEQNVVKISDLKKGQIERIVGMVNSIYISKDGHAFLKVADTSGEISVVAFKNSNIDEVFEIEVGDKVSVLGRIEEYKGNLEIIAKEIKRL